MDSEFFAKVRAAAAESVSLKPKPVLPPLRVGWKLRGGILEVLWPNGSPWVRCRPEGLVSDSMVARMASEAVRRMWLTLGPETTKPFLWWLQTGNDSTGLDGVALLPFSTLGDALLGDASLREALTLEIAPDLSMALQVLPPEDGE